METGSISEEIESNEDLMLISSEKYVTASFS
jgi:hypothetical protein